MESRSVTEETAVLSEHGVHVVCNIWARKGYEFCRREWFLAKACEEERVDGSEACCWVHSLGRGGGDGREARMAVRVEYKKADGKGVRCWEAVSWRLRRGAVRNVLDGVGRLMSTRSGRELWWEAPLVVDLMAKGSLLQCDGRCSCYVLSGRLCAWCAGSEGVEIPQRSCVMLSCGSAHDERK
jgi:hypothetical protein